MNEAARAYDLIQDAHASRFLGVLLTYPDTESGKQLGGKIPLKSRLRLPWFG